MLYINFFYCSNVIGLFVWGNNELPIMRTPSELIFPMSDPLSLNGAYPPGLPSIGTKAQNSIADIYITFVT